MALDFPSPASNGQQYSSGGVTWQYDGAKWVIVGAGTPYLPLTGGQLNPGGLLIGAAGTVPPAGSLTLNANTVAPPAGNAGNLAIAGADGVNATIALDAFGAGGPYVVARRARGTAAARAAVQTNDVLLQIAGTGYGTAYGAWDAASFYFQATENWTGTANGTRAVIQTTVSGSTTEVASLTLAGNSATFSGSVTIPGTITTNSPITMATGGGTDATLTLQNTNHNWAIISQASSGNLLFYDATASAIRLTLAGNTATFSGQVNANVVQVSGSLNAINFQERGTSVVWALYSDAGTAAINNGSGNVFNLTTAGNLQITGAVGTKASGTTWANPSSRDIKNDIQPYDKGLQAILGLKPSTYRFQRGLGLPEGRHIGLVHDETKHMPEMHTTARIGSGDEEREVDALDCSAVTFALVNAVRELKAEIDALKPKPKEH